MRSRGQAVRDYFGGNTVVQVQRDGEHGAGFHSQDGCGGYQQDHHRRR